MKKWNIYETTGYEPKTTFWEDFTVAEKFGTDTVKNTYKKIMKEWKDNYVYLTELSLVLNHKIWEVYTDNLRLARLYNRLWEETNDYAMTHLKHEELDYYFDITD